MNPGEAFGAAVEALGVQAANRGTVGIDGEKEVLCPTCDGYLVFSAAAPEPCPFCLTPLEGAGVHDSPGHLEVDAILPFVLDAAAVEEAAERWIQKRKGAPKAFKKMRDMGSLVSVYASYYTYDVAVETHYNGQRGTEQRSPMSGSDDSLTSTFMEWEPVTGIVGNSFEDVMVLANTGFDGDHVHELEPWPMDDVVSFRPELLAGHLWRAPDLEPGKGFVAAGKEMMKDIEKSVTSHIGGGDQKVDRLFDVELHGLTYQHLLLPIWLLAVEFEGETYQMFINGSTGEVHGERPYTKLVGALRFWD